MGQGKRIVLATYGTLGDLHPYLAIALELQHRGHRPLIATSEYHRQLIEAAGLAFHALKPDISFTDRELHRRFTEPKRGLERVIREVMMPALRSTYDGLVQVVQTSGGADLLISHILMFAAPLVAEATGIRWVSTELQPGAFISAYDPPVPAPLPALASLRGLGATFHAALFGFARLTVRPRTTGPFLTEVPVAAGVAVPAGSTREGTRLISCWLSFLARWENRNRTGRRTLLSLAFRSMTKAARLFRRDSRNSWMTEKRRSSSRSVPRLSGMRAISMRRASPRRKGLGAVRCCSSVTIPAIVS